MATCLQTLANTHFSGSIILRVNIVRNLIFLITPFGRIGVVIFFLISGYVIPNSLQGRDINQFFISRIFRLYPAYWSSIIASILVSGIPSLIILIANFTMFQKFIGIGDINGVFWTLQIEIIFYVVCVLLFQFKILFNDKAINNIFILFLFLSLVVSFLRFELDKKLPVAAVLGITVMFLGFIFRKFTQQNAYFTKSKILFLFGLFIVILLPISLLAYNKNYAFDEKWYQYFYTYSIALIVFLLFYYYKIANQVLVYLGLISYSVYLFHNIVLDCMERLDLKAIINPIIFSTVFCCSASCGIYLLLFN